jgi:signal peptidase I
MYLVVTVTFVACALLPMILSWTPTIVMSGSMLPNIQPGAVLVAQPIAQDQIKPTLRKGQVLLSRDPSHPETLITHRVHELFDNAGRNVTTKGDANKDPDSTPMPIENILGYERIHVPLIGLPIQAMRLGNYAPLAIFLFVTMLAQIMVMSESKRQRYLEDDPWDDGPKRGRRRVNGTIQDWQISAALITAAIVAALLMLIGGAQASQSAVTSNDSNTFSTPSAPEVIP